jgi:basic membrane lipoprotein Med (substrate-binding protein (PBP1-ABC) superfamily)/DNA-binding SARP family transcriptional activator
MEFRVLGTLEAAANGSAADLGPPKQRALLASLLLHAGEIVPVDRLIDLLWGEEAPRTAPHSIQIYISNLRRALEPLGGADLIVTRHPGYLLDAERDSIDVYRFERLVHDGARMLEAGGRDEGRATLRRALGLWRGPALSDFAYEEFAQPHIRRLHEMHLDAIEILAGAELEAGRTADALSLLTAAARDDPLRERSRELLMLALYRSGRHADALRTFDALRTQLGEELGIDPSPGIRALYDRILLHDPSLLPEHPAGRVAEVRNPYKGLRPFTEEDAADFFGRDELVQRLVAMLADGVRLISLVGPSGSGKSSVVAAGLVPRLRAGDAPESAGWRVGRMTPGPNPLRELQAILDRAPSSEPGGDTTTTLLVIDQLEQTFAAAEDAARNQFLATLADAVASPEDRLRVIVTLRADYYDRPLLHPEFAAVFTSSVVNVVPMPARELEEAIVEPARRAGVEVEPALLAELIGDTANRPGSLPLLQYALTELFDQRSGPMLTRASYASLGGLRGLLTRRAESLYQGLDPEAQQAAMQLFLRLVHPGEGVLEARRRPFLRELTDLGIDPVVLSAVLTTFGRHRLLTFDRDAASEQATVEVAHEALLVEWDRLAGWIDRHRAALRRHAALAAAAEEWELSGRDPDYLLTGSRLREFEAWRKGGALRLSGRERAFLDAAIERRRAAEKAEAARIDLQRRAERRARRRVAALGIVVVLLAVGLGFAFLAGIGTPATRVALFTSSEGGVVGGIVESAFDRGVGDFGLSGRKIDTRDLLNSPNDYEHELRAVSAEAALVMVFDVINVEEVARDFPQTPYVVFDYAGTEPNIAYVTFKEWEAAFLAGVAAALTTETGTVGLIGGMDWPPIWGFAAGYAAGARAARADITVLTTYLSDSPRGFLDPAPARAAAERMYAEGADIVFNVAGTAGLGIFEAAADMSVALDRQLWAIGVDSDQYETVLRLPGAATRAGEWRPHILTSMLKRFDLAVRGALEDIAAGEFSAGVHILDLASGGVDISYSGGFLDDVRAEIERYRSQIIARTISVPCIPEDRVDAATDFAQTHLGMTLDELLEWLGCAPIGGGT